MVQAKKSHRKNGLEKKASFSVFDAKDAKEVFALKQPLKKVGRSR